MLLIADVRNLERGVGMEAPNSPHITCVVACLGDHTPCPARGYAIKEQC